MKSVSVSGGRREVNLTRVIELQPEINDADGDEMTHSLDQFVNILKPHISVLVVEILAHGYENVIRPIALGDFVGVFEEFL